MESNCVLKVHCIAQSTVGLANLAAGYCVHYRVEIKNFRTTATHAAEAVGHVRRLSDRYGPEAGVGE